MDDETRADVQRYVQRAWHDIKAVEVNLQNGFYAVAISRAYYAMFYAATALLKTKGIERSRHAGVISAFGQYFVKTGIFEVEYARILSRAYESRSDTDYDVRFVSDEELSQKRLNEARQFVTRAEKYLEEMGAL